jgi:2,3-bisphosphoglycerate-independent phosphoglycerate mutase
MELFQQLAQQTDSSRIPTELSERLAAKLPAEITLPGAELFVRPEMVYRDVVILRGEGLGEEGSDSDPQVVGVPPLEMKGQKPASERTAALANTFVKRAREVRADELPANWMLLREPAPGTRCRSCSTRRDACRTMPSAR